MRFDPGQGEFEHANKHRKRKFIGCICASLPRPKGILHYVIPSVSARRSSGYSNLYLGKLLFSVVTVENCSDMPASFPFCCICLSLVAGDIILLN